LRDLRRRQTADEAERQRDLRLGGKRRVAAGEDQLESLVRNHCFLVVGNLLRACEELCLAGERLLAADAVDGAVARGRHDPGAGVRRRPMDRPTLGGDDERILNSVLGAIEIAEDAAENCDAARTLISIGAGERVYSRYSECSRTGRISIVPYCAAGILSARAIASSSESASIRQYPPSCSRGSAKGPSFTRVSPFRTRTVVAVESQTSSSP